MTLTANRFPVLIFRIARSVGRLGDGNRRESRPGIHVIGLFFYRGRDKKKAEEGISVSRPNPMKHDTSKEIRVVRSRIADCLVLSASSVRSASRILHSWSSLLFPGVPT